MLSLIKVWVLIEEPKLYFLFPKMIKYLNFKLVTLWEVGQSSVVREKYGKGRIKILFDNIHGAYSYKTLGSEFDMTFIDY